MRTIIIYILLMCCIASCVQNEWDYQGSGNTHIQSPEKILTKSIADYEGTDSLETISKIQSDKDLMLIKHIIIEDGKYVLNISTVSAQELGLDISTYSNYVNMLNSLNE